MGKTHSYYKHHERITIWKAERQDGKQKDKTENCLVFKLLACKRTQMHYYFSERSDTRDEHWTAEKSFSYVQIHKEK